MGRSSLGPVEAVDLGRRACLFNSGRPNRFSRSPSRKVHSVSVPRLTSKHKPSVILPYTPPDERRFETAAEQLCTSI